jgi:hypothetical protein
MVEGCCSTQAPLKHSRHPNKTPFHSECLLLLLLLLLLWSLLQSVAEDAMPWLMKTRIPPLWQHPVGPAAYPFAIALTTLFYGPSIGTKFSGLLGVLKALTLGAGGKSATQQKAKAS